ncbi:MAG: helix-turn-helix transcriptional regulator [Verrucomicrobia bacterium]|nr:helix-turn-helix transcriptional regulator [Verrucomicrobiota bacterium]
MQPHRHLSVRQRANYHRLEEVVGCKWSAAVIAAVASGVLRPGALERHIPGISTKVLNERLRKLRDFGILIRTEFPGLPGRVEYTLTPIGHRLADILRQLEGLNEQHLPGAGPAAP